MSLDPEGKNPRDLGRWNDPVQFERALRRIILYRIAETVGNPAECKALVERLLAESKYRQEDAAIERALSGTDPEHKKHLEQLLSVLAPDDPRRKLVESC